MMDEHHRESPIHTPRPAPVAFGASLSRTVASEWPTQDDHTDEVVGVAPAESTTTPPTVHGRRVFPADVASPTWDSVDAPLPIPAAERAEALTDDLGDGPSLADESWFETLRAAEERAAQELHMAPPVRPPGGRLAFVLATAALVALGSAFGILAWL